MNTQNTATKSTMRMTWVMAAALSTGMLAITLLPGVTRAAVSGNDVPNAVVSYKDLDMSTTQGGQTLYKRIRFAADQVCGKSEAHSLHDKMLAETCFDRAVSQAVAQVNNPMLTQVYLAKKAGNAGQQSLAIAQVR
jgi:UrcA family protein